MGYLGEEIYGWIPAKDPINVRSLCWRLYSVRSCFTLFWFASWKRPRNVRVYKYWDFVAKLCSVPFKINWLLHLKVIRTSVSIWRKAYVQRIQIILPQLLLRLIKLDPGIDENSFAREFPLAQADTICWFCK